MKHITAALFTFLTVTLLAGMSLADNDKKTQKLSYINPTFFVQNEDQRADIMLVRPIDGAMISIKELDGAPDKIEVIDAISGSMLKEKDECTSRSKRYGVPESDSSFVEVNCGELTALVFWVSIGGHTYASIMTWPGYDKYDEHMSYVFIRSLKPKS